MVSKIILIFIAGLMFSCSVKPLLKSKPATAEKSGVKSIYGSPPTTKSLARLNLPTNPYLQNGRNGLHYDTYNSDVTNETGPTGTNPFITSHKLNGIGKSNPTILFDSKGRIITVMITFTGTYLYLMDPYSLDILAKERLPRKNNIHVFNRKENDASGGGYLHLTVSGEVIVPKMDKKIAFYNVIEEQNKPQWKLVKEIDLKAELPKKANITDAVFDYDGQLWFTTSTGIVGFVDKTSEKINTYIFSENLQNQVAIDTSGVYILTNGSLNKLLINDNGKIQLKWSSKYDNSAGLTGLVGSGSGTSPTLFGNNDDLIAIADNGKPQMHLNVYHRFDGRLISSTPVFDTINTGCENSPIGFGNELVIENNGGFELFFGDPQTTNKGLAKIRVHEDLKSAEIVWINNDLRASTTPILSTSNGIIYSYCVKKGSNGHDAWFLSMVDWKTGKTVYQYWVGSGRNYPDMLQPVVIDSGAFYIGTRTGILVVRDK